MFSKHFMIFHSSKGAVICVKTRKGINKFYCNNYKVRYFSPFHRPRRPLGKVEV